MCVHTACCCVQLILTELFILFCAYFCDPKSYRSVHIWRLSVFSVHWAYLLCGCKCRSRDLSLKVKHLRFKNVIFMCSGHGGTPSLYITLRERFNKHNCVGRKKIHLHSGSLSSRHELCVLHRIVQSDTSASLVLPVLDPIG